MTTYSEVVLGLNPLVHPAFEETSGTVAADASPNARHGSYVGAPTLDAPALAYGSTRSVTFNGSTQLAEVPYASWMNVSDFTMAAVVQPSIVSGARTIMCRYLGSGGDAAWTMRAEGDRFNLYTKTAAGGFTTLQSASNMFVANQKFHLVVTLSGTTAKIYMDGVEVASGTVPAVNITGTAPLTIGAARVNGASTIAEAWQGSIDKPAFYGYAMTPAEVTTLYGASVTTLDLSASTPPTAEVFPLNLGAILPIPKVFNASDYEYRIDGGAAVSVAAGSGDARDSVGAVVKLLGSLTNVAHTVAVRALNAYTSTATAWSADVTFTPSTTSGKHWDDFERADSTTVVGTPVYGNAYTTVGGRVWGLIGGSAYAPGGSGLGHLITDVGTADIRVAVQRTNTAAGWMGFIFRYIDASNYWYVQHDGNGPTNGNLRMYRYVAGAQVQQTSLTPVAWPVGSVLEASAFGERVVVRLNGRVALACSDIYTRTGATKVGFSVDTATGRFGLLTAMQLTGTEDDTSGALVSTYAAITTPSTTAGHVYKGRDSMTADTGSVA